MDTEVQILRSQPDIMVQSGPKGYQYYDAAGYNPEVPGGNIPGLIGVSEDGRTMFFVFKVGGKVGLVPIQMNDVIIVEQENLPELLMVRSTSLVDDKGRPQIYDRKLLNRIRTSMRQTRVWATNLSLPSMLQTGGIETLWKTFNRDTLVCISPEFNLDITCSRREFLALAALTGAGIVLLASGCQAQPTEQSRQINPTEIFNSLSIDIKISSELENELRKEEKEAILRGFAQTLERASRHIDIAGNLRHIQLVLDTGKNGMSTAFDPLKPDEGIIIKINPEAYRSQISSINELYRELESSASHEAVHVIGRSSSITEVNIQFSNSFLLYLLNGFYAYGENLAAEEGSSQRYYDTKINSTYSVRAFEEGFAYMIELILNPNADEHQPDIYTQKLHPLFIEIMEKCGFDEEKLWHILWTSDVQQFADRLEVTLVDIFLAFNRLEYKEGYTLDDARKELNLDI